MEKNLKKQPRDRTQVSCIAGGFFTSWAIREPHERVCIYICITELLCCTLETNIRVSIILRIFFFKLTFTVVLFYVERPTLSPEHIINVRWGILFSVAQQQWLSNAILSSSNLLAQSIYHFDIYTFNVGFLKLFIWLHWVLLAAWRLSLAAVSGGCSFAQASLVAVHGLQSVQASVAAEGGLSSTGTVVRLLRLSCFQVCGIFLDGGLNSSIVPALAGGFLSTVLPESPNTYSF